MRDAQGDVIVDSKMMDRLRTTGVKGWAPVWDFEGPTQDPVLKLTPWYNDPLWRDRETGEFAHAPTQIPGQAYVAPPSVMEAIESRKAPIVRTSATEKFEWLKKMLREDARRFTQADGKVVWPASVQRELTEAAWKIGKAGVLDVEEQVELLARTYVTFAAHRQKEHDGKHPSSVHPSRGHYAA